jgi:hypothetical protein
MSLKKDGLKVIFKESMNWLRFLLKSKLSFLGELKTFGALFILTL